MQVRLQGGGTGDDREGESGGEAGEDSQSLTDRVCLFRWKMGFGEKKIFLEKKGKGFEM